MLGYNPERKKVEEAIQQIYRDFASEYGEIQKSELEESEKYVQIRELFEKASNTEEILKNTMSLAELSDEDKEVLGIKGETEKVVDEKVVDTLVSIYAQRAKTPNTSNRNVGVGRALTLSENETLEEIDTTAFEEELRQYFTEHYADLISDGYNNFLSEITEVPDDIGILHNKYGDLTQIAMKHDIEPGKFNCFGYQLTIQDGFVAEEDSMFGKSTVLYATPEGINRRIFDLYSKSLYREQQNNNGTDFSLDHIRKLKNTYITYAEKNGIEIENSDVLETIDVDRTKVQALAKYINRVVNSRDNIEKGDYTQLFSDDIIKNYSKIMNLQWYSFGDLESVEGIVGENAYIDGLHLKIEEDSITHPDDFRPDIAYGTPEYLKSQYESVMAKVKELHTTNAFANSKFDILKVNKEKQALRRYIQENGIEGINIEIPQVEINHDMTNMIADALMEQYGAEYEDKEAMRARILSKLEENWSEVMTEQQCVDINDLFKKEVKEMGRTYADETLYVKDDFIYLGDFSNFRAKCIYATPEALKNNISALDSKISSRDFCFEEEEARKVLEQYAEDNEIALNIPDLESVKAKRQEEKERFSFGGPLRMFEIELMPDDPTARPKIELKDTIIDVIMKMTDGNPGAIVGLTSMLKADKTGGMLLLSLDDMNIRETQIWEAYKYLYHEDGEKFAKAVKRRDPKMVDFINQELASVGGEKAVTGGASFDRHKTPDKYRFTEEEVEQLKQEREERIAKEKVIREKLLANSPVKKNRGAKKRAQREVRKQEYRETLIAKGKKSLGELDEELTSLQEKEKQAKELCEQYEQQLPEKPDQEL